MITPKGFFKRFLETQLQGLTGNIHASGYPFDIVSWGDADYISDKVQESCTWWPYEQTGYWLDGFTRLGILLNDKSVIDKASKIIYSAIDNCDKDGYIGPSFMKNGGCNYRWAHAVFFRACIALYDYNKDEKIISALTKHYLNSDYNHDQGRDVINAEIMCLLYERNGEYALIERAIKAYDAYNLDQTREWRDEVILSRNKPFVHGVTYNETMKIPLLLYKHTKNKRYLKVALTAIEKLEKYFMLPGGIINSDEYTESNYYYYCYETCDITDFTWALSYFQQTLLQAKYGDMIEKCVFNAGIGSVLEDFKGLQYLSCANQLLLVEQSSHCEYHRGTKEMSYRPNPFIECCPGNVNRFMPNYILNMFTKNGNEIYCNLFGACEYQTEINGETVTIKEETLFPFNESFCFSVQTKTPIQLFIRNPSYYSDYKIDAGENKVELKNGYFVIELKNDATISLDFESEIVEHIIKGNNKRSDGVYYSKGVLVYSDGQKGERIIDENEERQTKDLPAYVIRPNKEWGYGVKNQGKAIFNAIDVDSDFDLDKPLPTITVSGAKIVNASFKKKKTIVRRVEVNAKGRKYSDFIKVKGDFSFTPDLLKTKNEFGEDKPLTLYPYGACKIRQTVFPIKK